MFVLTPVCPVSRPHGLGLTVRPFAWSHEGRLHSQGRKSAGIALSFFRSSHFTPHFQRVSAALPFNRSCQFYFSWLELVQKGHRFLFLLLFTCINWFGKEGTTLKTEKIQTKVNLRYKTRKGHNITHKQHHIGHRSTRHSYSSCRDPTCGSRLRPHNGTVNAIIFHTSLVACRRFF